MQALSGLNFYAILGFANKYPKSTNHDPVVGFFAPEGSEIVKYSPDSLKSATRRALD